MLSDDPAQLADTPFIPLGPKGSFDSTIIFGGAVPFTHNDQVHIFYSAGKTLPISCPPSIPEAGGSGRQRSAQPMWSTGTSCYALSSRVHRSRDSARRPLGWTATGASERRGYEGAQRPGNHARDQPAAARCACMACCGGRRQSGQFHPRRVCRRFRAVAGQLQAHRGGLRQRYPVRVECWGGRRGACLGFSAGPRGSARVRATGQRDSLCIQHRLMPLTGLATASQENVRNVIVSTVYTQSLDCSLKSCRRRRCTPSSVKLLGASQACSAASTSGHSKSRIE